MTTARLFLALDGTAELRRQLASCTRSLSATFAGVRWVRPEAMHLTLFFFGDTPEERLEDLIRAVSGAVRGHPPVPCVVLGLGVFPDVHRPRVLWAGVSVGAQALAHLAARVRGNLREAGFSAEDRPFTAHVTIGRFRSRPESGRPTPLQNALERYAGTRFGSLVDDHVTLYASTMTPAGPHYDVLHSWPLTV